MRFIDFSDVQDFFKGKSVAIVGGGPVNEDHGFIDSHDLVVRINNFKLNENTGFRTDVFYSYFGKAIRKTHEELKDVQLCMCKCPHGKIESEWHERTGRLGSDFHYIYQLRQSWWFCDTYVPGLNHFKAYMDLLDGHIPTTGFSCILDISKCDCDITIVGFDFFESGLHNLNEPWRKGNPEDPIGHRPIEERRWVLKHKDRYDLRI